MKRFIKEYPFWAYWIISTAIASWYGMFFRSAFSEGIPYDTLGFWGIIIAIVSIICVVVGTVNLFMIAVYGIMELVSWIARLIKKSLQKRKTPKQG